MSVPVAIAVGVVVAATYLLGAVPFGLLLAKWRGVDIRRVGSGNIGATNVWRTLGRRYGLLAFALDTAKGVVPMVVAPPIWRAAGAWPAGDSGGGFYACWLAVGAAAILGHVFPCYLRFRGGKGVATSLGVLLGLWPYYTVPGLICFGLWGVVFGVTRYVSVASILAAMAFPAVYFGLAVARGWEPWGRQRSLLIFAVVMALLVVYRHRMNLQRLLAGQENRFGMRPTSGADGASA